MAWDAPLLIWAEGFSAKAAFPPGEIFCDDGV